MDEGLISPSNCAMMTPATESETEPAPFVLSDAELKLILRLRSLRCAGVLWIEVNGNGPIALFFLPHVRREVLQ